MRRGAATVVSAMFLGLAIGCAGGRGTEVVDDEITTIIDLVDGQEGSRRFAFDSSNRLNCDQEPEDRRYETRRAFRTYVKGDQDQVVDRLVDHYRSAGAELYQYRQEPGPTILLRIADRRRNLYVRLSINPQGFISPGSVFYTPCGIDSLPGPPPVAFDEEEPGS